MTKSVCSRASTSLMLSMACLCLCAVAPKERTVECDLAGLTRSHSPPQAVQSHPALARSAAADAFFTGTKLSSFEVVLGASEYQRLLESPREYVPGKVTIDGKVFTNVGVRLKGTGTFQPVSRRPNLAVKFNWKTPGQEFAGLTKLLLNNSRQDPTLLCELISGSAFADAGVPTPRITHARVSLNGRDLGRYVVAEAVNRRFLKKHFNAAEGNLYEGAFQDIRARLKQENGLPSNRSDLRQLCEAAQLTDDVQRRQALEKVLDVEAFLNFLAVEMIVASWDGYAIHQNNYRIYHDPSSGRMTFIPHGLDNTLFESGLSLMPPRKSILAAALLATPEGRAAFRERVAALLPKVLDPEKVKSRLQAGVTRLSQDATPSEVESIVRRAALVQQRVEQRHQHLRAELADDAPPTPVFDSRGAAPLREWLPRPDSNDSPVHELTVQGKAALAIVATNDYCFGSWRLPVWLPPGSYRLEGMARTDGVSGLPSMTGSGAGVRIPQGLRGSGVQRTQEWTPVHHDFVVEEGCEWVELIAELRAYRGSASFDRDSLRLVRTR